MSLHYKKITFFRDTSLINDSNFSRLPEKEQDVYMVIKAINDQQGKVYSGPHRFIKEVLALKSPREVSVIIHKLAAKGLLKINKIWCDMEGDYIFSHEYILTGLSGINNIKKPLPTRIYVMIDNYTGKYKIGRSTNPDFREKTLLSQAPDIELLFHFKGTTDTEKELHLKYADKRYRGEWFSLTKKDVKEIKKYGGTLKA